MSDIDTILDRAVVGLALNGRTDLRSVRAVPEQWFEDGMCAAVWPIIQRLDREGTPLDPQVLIGHLGDLPEPYRSQANAAWVYDCQLAAPIGHLGDQYVTQMRERYWRRTMADSLTRGMQLLQGNASVREARLEVMSTLERIDLDSSSEPSMDEILDELVESYDQVSRFMPTPWAGLNAAVRGWRPGGLYVVGARPGVGKSIMLLQAAVGLTRNGPVLLENLEMTPGEVMNRLVSSASGVPLTRLNGRREDGSGGPDEVQDWPRLRESIGWARRLPLVVRGQRTRTPLDVREHARAVAGDGHLAGIVLDYLQLFRSGTRTDSRVQEVSEITRDLKLMAQEFDCPVIVASQLNRESQKDPTGGMNLTALRESGSIEQDADVVLFIAADKASEGSMEDKKHGIAVLNAAVLKNRQGPMKRFPLIRRGRTATIEDDPNRDYQ